MKEVEKHYTNIKGPWDLGVYAAADFLKELVKDSPEHNQSVIDKLKIPDNLHEFGLYADQSAYKIGREYCGGFLTLLEAQKCSAYKAVCAHFDSLLKILASAHGNGRSGELTMEKKQYIVLGSNNFWYSVCDSLEQAREVVANIPTRKTYGDPESDYRPDPPAECIYIYESILADRLDLKDDIVVNESTGKEDVQTRTA